jgi:hypothetical protein
MDFTLKSTSGSLLQRSTWFEPTVTELSKVVGHFAKSLKSWTTLLLFYFKKHFEMFTLAIDAYLVHWRPYMVLSSDINR